jgi:TolB-like protein
MAWNNTVTAADPSRTLVLPFRTIGVSDTTAAVVADLLRGDLERHGVQVISAASLGAGATTGDSACDDVECATAAAKRAGATQVVYGSMSRLGGKVIVGVRALRTGETKPFYFDQLSANTVDDLDAVVRRIGDTLAAGEVNAGRATIENVTAAETLEPRRRASNAGVSVRAGFLFPFPDSYGGVDRLTSLRLAVKYETTNHFIETTPLLGFAWRGSTLEWTALDVFAARILSTADFAPYLGAGLGVHAVHLEQKTRVYSPLGSYDRSASQSETTLTADVGCGLLALRTFDFRLIVDLRYHAVFSGFDRLGGHGAHGIALTFGTSR